MPYSGVPSSLTKKMESCVVEVMKSGKDKESAIKICRGQVMEAMDKNSCHDIVHMNAGTTEQCPYCQGKMTAEDMKKEADRIMSDYVRNKAMQSKWYMTPMMGNDGKVSTPNFRRIVEISGDDTIEETEVQVVPVGKWNTTKYGEIEITEEDVNKMADNFKVRKGIPIDTDHDGGAANGWVDRLVSKGKDGLYAVIKWTSRGKELLKDKIYKYFSPEFSLNYIDPQSSKEYGPVFIAGTLTNRPLFKHLPALTASESKTGDLTNNEMGIIIVADQQTMDITAILSKAKADRTAEEVAFLAQAQLSDEQKAQLDKENEPVETEEQKKAREEAEAKSKADADAKAKADAEATTHANETVSIKASELADLKNGVVEARELKKKMLRIEATELVTGKYILNEKSGRVLPKAKEILVDLVLSFNDEQKKMFDTVMSAIPSNLKFGEIGRGEGSPLTAAEEFEKLVSSKIKANEKMSYADAVKEVAAENKELYQKYNEELTVSTK